MKEIIKAASELKETILQDERYLSLLQKEKRMQEDEEVIRLAYKKDIKENEYNDALRHFSKDSKEVKKAQKEFYLAKKELESHPIVIDYLKAYQEVRLLLENVNEILFKDLSENK